MTQFCITVEDVQQAASLLAGADYQHAYPACFGFVGYVWLFYIFEA